MEDPENDVDIETLQAQIDLSLAHTQNLISSWMKPKYDNATASSSRANQEKELEELMKRPQRYAYVTITRITSNLCIARLGVGAPIPASTGVAGHEAMKLKGKLTGKKRPREEDDVKVIVISEDEEESRAGAIKKKARQDPFALKPKKSTNAPAVLPAKLPSKAAGKKLGSPTKALPQKGPAAEAKVVAGLTTKQAQTASPSKSKTDAPEADDDESEGMLSPFYLSHSFIRCCLFLDDASMDVDEPEGSAPAGKKGDGKAASKGQPLLNLEGPPPTVGASPSKKKRKRNKKKKKGGKAKAS